MARNRVTRSELGDIHAALHARFPDVFNRDSPRPLLVGASREIKKAFPQFTNREIQAFLFWWCRRSSYLQAVVQPGSCRYKLDSSQLGSVNDKSREYSRELLQNRDKKSLKRRQQRVLP